MLLEAPLWRLLLCLDSLLCDGLHSGDIPSLIPPLVDERTSSSAAISFPRCTSSCDKGRLVPWSLVSEGKTHRSRHSWCAPCVSSLRTRLQPDAAGAEGDAEARLSVIASRASVRRQESLRAISKRCGSGTALRGCLLPSPL